MKIQIITLFPDSFRSYFEHSMMFKAQEKGLLELKFIDLRDFGLGKRKTVDDTPYGGGDGMVLRADVVIPAIESTRSQEESVASSQESEQTPNSKLQTPRVILLTPQGKTFKQADAKRLSKQQHLILVCGHYEGFDERIRDSVDEQISIGDYVLTGGELPAMVLIDAITRLVPGVLGGEKSAEVETFSEGQNIEYPQYTKPEDYKGKKVPEVLLSGHHGEIAKWRQKQSEIKTNTHNKF